MYCAKCGNPIEGNFCAKCGAPAEQPPIPQPTPPVAPAQATPSPQTASAPQPTAAPQPAPAPKAAPAPQNSGMKTMTIALITAGAVIVALCITVAVLVFSGGKEEVPVPTSSDGVGMATPASSAPAAHSAVPPVEPEIAPTLDVLLVNGIGREAVQAAAEGLGFLIDTDRAQAYTIPTGGITAKEFSDWVSGPTTVGYYVLNNTADAGALFDMYKVFLPDEPSIVEERGDTTLAFWQYNTRYCAAIWQADTVVTIMGDVDEDEGIGFRVAETMGYGLTDWRVFLQLDPVTSGSLAGGEPTGELSAERFIDVLLRCGYRVTDYSAQYGSQETEGFDANIYLAHSQENFASFELLAFANAAEAETVWGLYNEDIQEALAEGEYPGMQMVQYEGANFAFTAVSVPDEDDGITEYYAYLYQNSYVLTLEADEEDGPVVEEINYLLRALGIPGEMPVQK